MREYRVGAIRMMARRWCAKRRSCPRWAKAFSPGGAFCGLVRVALSGGMLVLMAQSPLLAAGQTDTLADGASGVETDSARISMYLRLGQRYQDSGLATAMRYYNEAKRLATTSSGWNRLGRVHYAIGNLYLRYEQYQHASSHFAQAVRDYMDEGNDRGKAASLNNLGITFRRMGCPHEASMFFMEALRIYKQRRDTAGTASVFNHLAQIYSQYGDYQQAIGFFDEFLLYCRGMGDSLAVASGENNLGVVYYESKQYSQALTHFYASLQLYDSLRRPEGVAIAKDNIGLMLYQLGQYRDAISYHHQAVDLFARQRDAYHWANSLCNLSQSLRKSDRVEEAMKAIGQGIRIADSLQNQELRRIVTEEYARCLHAEGRLNEAIEQYEQCLEMSKELGKRKGQEDLEKLRGNSADVIQWLNSNDVVGADYRGARGRTWRFAYTSIILAVGGIALGFAGHYAMMRWQGRRRKMRA